MAFGLKVKIECALQSSKTLQSNVLGSLLNTQQLGCQKGVRLGNHELNTSSHLLSIISYTMHIPQDKICQFSED